MRITNQTMNARALVDLQRTQAQIAKTQEQLSSGKRITTASDDPIGARQALEARSEVTALQGHRETAAAATAWTDATDSALGSVTDAIHRVRELVTKAATSTTSQSDRLRIKDELDGLIAGVKDAMSAKVGDQYVFSGTATPTLPYTSASDAYAGDAGVVARTIGPGVAVQVNVLGSQVLGGGQAANDGRLLHTLRDIGDHLVAGNTTALATTDLQALAANLDAVLSVRATTGATANRIEAAGTRLAELEEVAQGRLGELAGVDYAKAALELNAQSTAYQAALKSAATVIQPSLLDFLR